MGPAGYQIERKLKIGYMKITSVNKEVENLEHLCAAVWMYSSAAVVENSIMIPEERELPFCCSVTKLCPTLWDPVDCSMPGLPVPQYLPEFAQIHVHWHVHNWASSFLLWSNSFILSGALSNCPSLSAPLAYWTFSDLGAHLAPLYHFAFSCCSWGSRGKNAAVVCHSLLQWTTFCQNAPLGPIHPGGPTQHDS